MHGSLFRDANAGAYAGRTMELSMELPYVVASIPKGHQFTSVVDGHNPLEFETKYSILQLLCPTAALLISKLLKGSMKRFDF